mmetsp:Transcript_22013/g.44795  ORF Transcript_22013/g.44795 Transcript_22013/m.44795 type:complete len:212 (+) Transcript_22013:127-762(+)
MQQVLSRGPNGETLRGGYGSVEGCIHLRGALYWMRYLREEMSVRGDRDHQLAEGHGKEHDAPLRAQQLQDPSHANTSARPSVGSGRIQRHRQIHCAQGFGGKVETKPRAFRQPAGLVGDPRLLPRLRAPKFLHSHSRGHHQGHHQASVCRPHSARYQGHRGGDSDREERHRHEGLPRPSVGPRQRSRSRRAGSVRRRAAALCHRCGRCPEG